MKFGNDTRQINQAEVAGQILDEPLYFQLEKPTWHRHDRTLCTDCWLHKKCLNYSFLP